MVEIEESIVISVPRDEVFEFASRPENMPLWNPVIRESWVVGTLEEGAKVVQLVDLLGRRFEAVYEVTGYQPSSRVEYASTSGPVEIRGAMEFRREKGGTRIRWTVGGDGRGLLRVAEGVLVGAGRPEMRACLENLKRAVEDGEPAHHVPSPLSLFSRNRLKLFAVVTSLVAQKS